jgi:para-aminobenzoate synthetase component 1
LHESRRRPIADLIGLPFVSGLIGFVGYEIGAMLEPAARGRMSPFALPDMAFGVYDAAILFDRLSRRAFLSNRDAKTGDRLLEAIAAPATAGPRPCFTGLRSNFTAQRYRKAVADVVAKIRDGVFFQANIAQHLSAVSADCSNAFDVFRAVAAGDSQFGAVLNFAEGAVVSASPERFFKCMKGDDETRIIVEPIKGTAKRSAGADDERAAAELLVDPKERAENIMIADLMRSDLSRICCDGSIREGAICELLSTRTVHHLVSRISGSLREGTTAVDALAALFPSGSVTGAPKIEAMRAIAEIEDVGRGPYCGAIGYFDDGGGADFSVAIRTIVLEKNNGGARATFPVGGGVTLRSDPQSEFEETLAKARALLDALGIEAAR